MAKLALIMHLKSVHFLYGKVRGRNRELARQSNGCTATTSATDRRRCSPINQRPRASEKMSGLRHHLPHPPRQLSRCFTSSTTQRVSSLLLARRTPKQSPMTSSLVPISEARATYSFVRESASTMTSGSTIHTTRAIPISAERYESPMEELEDPRDRLSVQQPERSSPCRWTLRCRAFGR